MLHVYQRQGAHASGRSREATDDLRDFTHCPVPTHPSCHKMCKSQSRVHVVGNPEPHGRQGGSGTAGKQAGVSKATLVFCAPLHFTGLCELQESRCIEAGTGDSEEQREERFLDNLVVERIQVKQ